MKISSRKRTDEHDNSVDCIYSEDFGKSFLKYCVILLFCPTAACTSKTMATIRIIVVFIAFDYLVMLSQKSDEPIKLTKQKLQSRRIKVQSRNMIRLRLQSISPYSWNHLQLTLAVSMLFVNFDPNKFIKLIYFFIG